MMLRTSNVHGLKVVMDPLRTASDSIHQKHKNHCSAHQSLYVSFLYIFSMLKSWGADIRQIVIPLTRDCKIWILELGFRFVSHESEVIEWFPEHQREKGLPFQLGVMMFLPVCSSSQEITIISWMPWSGGILLGQKPWNGLQKLCFLMKNKGGWVLFSGV